MGIFGVKQKPRKEITITTKTYAQEFDREPKKEKKGLFAQKNEPEPEPQDTMIEQNENPNQEENYGGTY